MPAVALPPLAKTQRAMLIASMAVVTLAAWLWLLQGHASHSAVLRPHHHPGAPTVSFVSIVVMWLAMSVAMMAPTTLNWLFAYVSLATKSDPKRTVRAVLEFAGGYFSVWLVYSVIAAGLQLALQNAGLLDGEGKLPSTAAGLVLMGAGAVYFTKLSRSCLKHCRNPLTYFVSRWENGPRSGFRFGAAHAVFCVGCCWLLMLTGFAMGVMNLLWMALLTILVCVEKLAPRGERIAGAAAVLMILWGAALSFAIPIQP
jgi:predicted metal-binding membrane protein